MRNDETTDVDLANHDFRVCKFMRLAGQKLPTVPTDLDDKQAKARAMMLLREALETCAGAGMAVTVTPVVIREDIRDAYPYGEKMHIVTMEKRYPFNMVEFVDGNRDCTVVATGNDRAAGVDPTRYQPLVDRANLRKFDPQYIEEVGGTRRKATREECKALGLGGYLEWEGPNAGKWIKPANWRDVMPEIAEQLKKDGYEG